MAFANVGLMRRAIGSRHGSIIRQSIGKLVRAGCGVGFTLSKVGRADPDMIEIPTGIEIETAASFG